MTLSALTRGALGLAVAAPLLAGCAGGTVPRYPYDRFSHGPSQVTPQHSVMKNPGSTAGAHAAPAGHGAAGSH